MKTTPIQVTSLEITGAPALDPIRVHFQDYEKGQGRITIECYGRAWACYWPGMGTTIREFILACDSSYIEAALHSGMRHTKRDTDYLIRIIKAIQLALTTP